jgi:hypothetical protein
MHHEQERRAAPHRRSHPRLKSRLCVPARVVSRTLAPMLEATRPRLKPCPRRGHVVAGGVHGPAAAGGHPPLHAGAVRAEDARARGGPRRPHQLQGARVRGGPRARPPHRLSAFRPRGVPGPTSKLSPRALAQIGRRETEREGGKKPEGDRRKRGNPRPSCLSRA